MTRDAERTPSDPHNTPPAEDLTTVPCVVCGTPSPEALGVCPGPLDGSMSECERTLKAETVKERLKFLMGIGPNEMFGGKRG